MALLDSGSDGCRWVTSSVHNVLAVVVLSLVEDGLNTWLSERPGTGVERLLLTPHNGLGVLVAVEVLLKLLPWEWVELLDTNNGGVLEVVLLAVLGESGVDLSGTENDALDLLWLSNGLAVLGLLNNPAEVAVTLELFNVGASEWVAEKSLGEEDAEWLAELSVHLSAQDVEVVGWGGHVRNLHVAVLVLTLKLLWGWEDTWVLVRKLEITLHTSGGVLWSLSIISMRKRHDEAGTLHPLDLTRSNELINDDLGVVCEITELGLPHDESVWRGQRVTVLESEDTVLREGGVRDDELALVLGDVLEWSPGLLVLLVVENSVTLGEGTTLNILTGNTDVVTLVDKGTEGQSLSGGPVDVLTLGNSLGSSGENTLQVAVDAEVIRAAANGDTNVLQSGLLNTGWWVWENLGGKLLWRLESVPGRGGPLLGGWGVVLAFSKGLLEHAPNPLPVLINIRLSEGLVLQELLDVKVDDWRVFLDALVHQWLGERWLIGLVVAVLSVADHVNDNIRAELSAPIGGKLANKIDSLDIVSVNVEDWRIDGFGNIGTVSGRAGETWVGGETDLVVDNNVNGSSGRVGWETVESHSLVNDTLTGESGITVEKNTHGSVVLLLVVVVVLDSTGLSKDNWILSLQMRWVGDQGKLNALSGWGWALKVHSQVVLDISGTLILSSNGSGKLGENGLVWLADDVGEDVQATTMWHTNNDILDTIVDGAIDKSLHSRNEGLASLKTETLIVRVLGSGEIFEGGRPNESVQDAALLIGGVLECLWDLDTLSQPVAALAVWNVNVLDTVGSAVDSFASLDDLAQSHLLTSLLRESWEDTWTEGVLHVEVLLSETVVVKLKFLRVGVTELLGLSANAERIDVCLVVTTGLVGADQKLDLQVVGNVAVLSGRHSWAWHERWDTSLGGWDEGWWWSERLGHWHVAGLHVVEICLPRDVDRGWVLLPGHVHLIDIVRRVTRQEAVIWVRSLRRGIALLKRGSQW